MELPGVTTLSVDNATIAFAFGLGIEETSEKVYFRDMASSMLGLRQNATWLKVGGMDISLPVLIPLHVLGNTLTINPIISISDIDLFGADSPEMSIDFNIE